MKILCVPIRIDALVDDQPTEVVLASNRFDEAARATDPAWMWQNTDGQLPLIRQPLSDTGTLSPGVHLHWTLPDALTKGDATENTLAFPQIPNRWLLIRRNAEQIATKHWVIESDYLYPRGVMAERAITIPDPDDSNRAEYRFMGRQLTLAQWQQDQGQQHEYLQDFTIQGWGSMLFSASYAECFSALGAFDDEPFAHEVEGTSYEVFGWYADTSNDYLTQHIIASVDENHSFAEALSSKTQWQLPNDEDSATQTLCYGKVEFAERVTLDDLIDAEDTTLSLGRTSTEATSAWLSQCLATDANDITCVENQLQAVLLDEDFRGDNIEFVNKLKNMRHRSQFEPVTTGSHFAFMEDSSLLGNATVSTDVKESALVGFRDFKTTQQALLDTINQLACQINQNKAIQQTQLSQIYADWQKYMVCLHATDTVQATLPDPGRIRDYIENHSLPKFDALSAQTAQLSDELKQHMAQIDTAFHDFTRQLNIPTHTFATTVLIDVPESRFWQPLDPMLMIAGEAVQPSSRHGADGQLPVQIVDVQTDTLTQWLLNDGHIETLNWEDHACNHWQQQPWLPLFTEWQLDIFADTHAFDGDVEGVKPYDTGFIVDHYRIPLNDDDYALPSAAVDLRPDQGTTINLAKEANTVKGRSLLPFTLEGIMKNRLADYLNDSEDDHVSRAARSTMSAALTQMNQQPCVLQKLNNLHNELLMTDNNGLLPMDDRLKDADGHDDALTRSIRSRLQGRRFSAPSLNQRFTPIKNGATRLQQLRIVDSFGRFKTISTDQVIRANHHRVDNSLSNPPRLLPPARLSFRWLNQMVDNGQSQSPICGWLNYNIFNESLVVYQSDGTLMGQIDADGEWLNALNQQQTLRLSDCPALYSTVLKCIGYNECKRISQKNFMQQPGASLALWRSYHQEGILAEIDWGSIIVPHTKAEWPSALTTLSVSYEYTQTLLEAASISKNNYLSRFKRALMQGLDNIEPAFSEFDAASNCTKPLAIIEASLDLQLLGEPINNKSWLACNQDFSDHDSDNPSFGEVRFPFKLGKPVSNQNWRTFKQNPANDDRNCRLFDEVKFPVKLGEFNNLDDGLVAYWQITTADVQGEGTSDRRLSKLGYFPHSNIEDMAGYTDTAYFNPDEHDYIDQVSGEGVTNLQQSLKDPAIKLLMLLDPEASVHATTGILPKKSLRLDASLYQAPLQKIQLDYFAAPLLTPNHKLALPMPGMGSWCWQWLNSQGDIEKAYNTRVVDQSAFLAGGATEATWLALLDADILALFNDNTVKARWLNAEPDVTTLPADIAQHWDSTIKPQLDNASHEELVAPDSIPVFSRAGRAVEGWIKPFSDPGK